MILKVKVPAVVTLRVPMGMEEELATRLAEHFCRARLEVSDLGLAREGAGAAYFDEMAGSASPAVRNEVVTDWDVTDVVEIERGDDGEYEVEVTDY